MTTTASDTRMWVEGEVMNIIGEVFGGGCTKESVEDQIRFIDPRPFMSRDLSSRIEDRFCLHDLQLRIKRLSFSQLVDLIVAELREKEVVEA